MDGGPTARVGLIIGPDHMTEMMVKGRKYSADNALSIGLAQYSVADGEAIELAQILAGKLSCTAPFSKMLMLQDIPRLNDMAPDYGSFTEALALSLSLSLSQTTKNAQEVSQALIEERTQRF